MERTLFEHGRREELALSGPNRRLRPFALRHVRGGLFTIRRSGVQVRLNLRRLDVRGGARLDLQLTARTRDVRALCSVLPASVSLDGRPLELETRLQLRDRGLIEPVTLRQRWRCTRDHNGEFTGIAPMQPRPVAARAGLTLRMQPPVAAASGRRAIVLVTVTNRRRSPSGRAVSSLWNLRITGTAGGPRGTVRRRELRAGRSRTIRLALTVPTTARGRVCVRVSAAADSARTDSARRCARVARAAPIAGLGSVGRRPPRAGGQPCGWRLTTLRERWAPRGVDAKHRERGGGHLRPDDGSEAYRSDRVARVRRWADSLRFGWPAAALCVLVLIAPAAHARRVAGRDAAIPALRPHRRMTACADLLFSTPAVA